MERPKNDDFINTPSELTKYIKEKGIENVLIGNGFGLSHPELRRCFMWDLAAVRNAVSNKPFSQCLRGSSKNPYCPETFLFDLRLYFVECILRTYIEKLCSAINQENDGNLSGLYFNYTIARKIKAADFLKLFKRVFTVNYDPLIYFEMLDLRSPSYGVNIFDGFIRGNDEFIPQQEIIKVLRNNKEDNNKIKLYFLHGSWFIQAKKDREYLRKVSFAKDKSYKIDNLFNWQEEQLPCIIFEDRPVVKEALIKKCEYFRGCLDIMENTEGHLLVFGMSFNRDDHILDALRKSNFKRIYFTYIDEKHKDFFKNKIVTKNIHENREIKFISVASNVIWQ